MAQLIKESNPGLIPGLGRSPGERKGYPLQYSGLENSKDCIFQGVTKSQTWLSNFHFHVPLYTLFFLVSCKDAKIFAPSIFFFVSTNRIFTGCVSLPASSPVKSLSFPQGPSHTPTLVCIIVLISPYQNAHYFLGNFTSLCSFLSYLARPTLYSVVWIFVPKLHSRWLVDKYPKAFSNFTCWEFNKCLCDRLYFAKVSAALTATPCALMQRHAG